MTGKPDVKMEADKAMAMLFWEGLKPNILPGLIKDLGIADMKDQLTRIEKLLLAIQQGLEDE